ncbi:formyl transferase [Pseudooceanicola aestuarii]|uniref:formyl transferase n=1 Tax=Pseudooceanicola aestuarii TaxID=2697319 RepID=UPI0013D409F8|nr:formyl transferase [Pseudooceanicola aestuarii]
MKICILATPGTSTDILRNYLADAGFNDVMTIVEKPVSKLAMLKHRRRRLGTAVVVGQLAFLALLAPLLRRESAGRRSRLAEEHDLRTTPATGEETQVDTINDAVVAEILSQARPDVVLVNGTRIIRERTLAAAGCPVINIHAGITPQYRGVHGGYWALRTGDAENFGVTIHQVDRGVDTGDVLRHLRTKPSVEDNFASYPLLQQATALPKLREILDDFPGSIELRPTVNPNDKSRQWYHPTLPGYLLGRLKGIK